MNNKNLHHLGMNFRLINKIHRTIALFIIFFDQELLLIIDA